MLTGGTYTPALPTTIGQAYGGGFYAGKIAVGGGGVATHYLIVAPKASGENSSLAWGPSGVTTGITAAGSTQGTATALTTGFNVVSTVAASTGVVFPTAVAGMRILVINLGANALSVYPASGGAINSIATNGAYSLAVGARLEFIATSTTQWYTLSATYA